MDNDRKQAPAGLGGSSVSAPVFGSEDGGTGTDDRSFESVGIVVARVDIQPLDISSRAEGVAVAARLLSQRYK